ncbi:hypothetical protein J7K43_01430 [Candidatus Calescamantes bacterium]|nr:hypothetical protein [Candidatus Calescamantes bacterium]
MDVNWKVKKSDGSIYGPVSTETLQRWIRERRVLAEDFITVEGKEEWKFAGSIPLFQALFGTEKGKEKGIPFERYCPYCKNPLPVGATFCTSCGTDLKTGKKAGKLVISKESSVIKRYLGNIVLGCLVVLSGLGAFIFSRYIYPVENIWMIAFRVAVSMGEAVCFYFILQFVVVLALMKKTPTTKIGDIKGDGFFEVHGKVLCGAPEVVYGLKCVYYDYVHYTRRHEFYRTTGSGYRYVRDIYEKKYVPFTVQDDTGEIGVDPAGAYFEPKVLNRGGSIIGEEKDTLRGITVGDEVYVLGQVVDYNGTLQFEKRRGILPLVISSSPESRLTLFLILRIFFALIIGALLPVVIRYIVSSIQ